MMRKEKVGEVGEGGGGEARKRKRLERMGDICLSDVKMQGEFDRAGSSDSGESASKGFCVVENT